MAVAHDIRASLYAAARAAAQAASPQAYTLAVTTLEDFAARDLFPLNWECIAKHLNDVPTSVLEVVLTHTRGALGMIEYDLSYTFFRLARLDMFNVIAVLCRVFCSTYNRHVLIDKAVSSLDPSKPTFGESLFAGPPPPTLSYDRFSALKTVVSDAVVGTGGEFPPPPLPPPPRRQSRSRASS
jgi:hypothetical protein